MPSNEGRGYVLRRIMRRGMRHSHLLGSKEPIFYNIFKTLKDEMKGNYSEIERAESLIKETLRMEEEKFLILLDRGIKILNEEITKIDKILPGEVAFKLYDTYGFPLDLTQDILKNKSLTIDNDKFQSLMKESKELAKKNWKGSGDSAVDDIWFSIKDRLGPSEFLGYETDQAEGIILSLLKDNKEVNELNKNDEGIIILNHSPFYGESGGQVGDTGVILSGNFKFEITDVQKKLGDLFVHYGKVKSGSIKIKDNVEMKIDIDRRNNIRAYHSATHLLHESLRRVLGTHVTQKGSLVAPDRLRFDFSHMKPISDQEIEKIENHVNSMVQKKSEVKTRIMTPKEAVDNGALAAGVRRVEALRENQLNIFLQNKVKLSDLSAQKDEEMINDLSKQIIKLGGKPNLENEDNKILIKELSKQLEQLKFSSILENNLKNIIQDVKINNISVRFQKVDDLPPKELRKLVDAGKKELKTGIVIVFASLEDKVGLAVGITDELIDKYDAVTFAKTGSEIIGGKGGGGRKDFAQAGGQFKDKIDEAFEKIKTLI